MLDSAKYEEELYIESRQPGVRPVVKRHPHALGDTKARDARMQALETEQRKLEPLTPEQEAHRMIDEALGRRTLSIVDRVLRDDYDVVTEAVKAVDGIVRQQGASSLIALPEGILLTDTNYRAHFFRERLRDIMDAAQHLADRECVDADGDLLEVYMHLHRLDTVAKTSIYDELGDAYEEFPKIVLRARRRKDESFQNSGSSVEEAHDAFMNLVLGHRDFVQWYVRRLPTSTNRRVKNYAEDVRAYLAEEISVIDKGIFPTRKFPADLIREGANYVGVDEFTEMHAKLIEESPFHTRKPVTEWGLLKDVLGIPIRKTVEDVVQDFGKCARMFARFQAHSALVRMSVNEDTKDFDLKVMKHMATEFYKQAFTDGRSEEVDELLDQFAVLFHEGTYPYQTDDQRAVFKRESLCSLLGELEHDDHMPEMAANIINEYAIPEGKARKNARTNLLIHVKRKIHKLAKDAEQAALEVYRAEQRDSEVHKALQDAHDWTDEQVQAVVAHVKAQMLEPIETIDALPKRNGISSIDRMRDELSEKEYKRIDLYGNLDMHRERHAALEILLERTIETVRELCGKFKTGGWDDLNPDRVRLQALVGGIGLTDALHRSIRTLWTDVLDAADEQDTSNDVPYLISRAMGLADTLEDEEPKYDPTSLRIAGEMDFEQDGIKIVYVKTHGPDDPNTNKQIRLDARLAYAVKIAQMVINGEQYSRGMIKDVLENLEERKQKLAKATLEEQQILLLDLREARERPGRLEAARDAYASIRIPELFEDAEGTDYEATILGCYQFMMQVSKKETLRSAPGIADRVKEAHEAIIDLTPETVLATTEILDQAEQLIPKIGEKLRTEEAPDADRFEQLYH